MDLESDPTPSSWFLNVLDQDTLTTPYLLRGEYEAQARIKTIEVSPDGGVTWLKAKVDMDTKTWSMHLSSPPNGGGTYHLLSRATDMDGRSERTLNPNVDVSIRKRPLTVHIVQEGTGRE
jgi:hypothetical protein